VAIKVNLLPREARAARSGRAAAAAIPRAGLGVGVGISVITKALLGVFVAMLLVMGLFGYRAWSDRQAYQAQITTLKAQNDQLKGQLIELDQAERAKAEIQRRIEVIGKVARSQGVPLAMLNGVLRAVPQGVWLYGVEMKPQEVKVKVEDTQTAGTVGDTLGRLEAKRTEVESQAPRPPQRGGPAPAMREVSQLAGYSVVIKGGAFNNFQIADFMDNLRKVGIFADVDFVVTEAERVEQTRVVSFEVTASVKL
jgi:Tfp pilus assembly protein PilN